MAIKPEKITAVGPAGTNGPKEGLGKALQRVVRLWRVSNPVHPVPTSEPACEARPGAFEGSTVNSGDLERINLDLAGGRYPNMRDLQTLGRAAGLARDAQQRGQV